MFCLFIGYPRSGHSLIGALLDAHPNAIIAHESHALKYIKEGFSKNQLFYLLRRNSIRSSKSGREWSGYSYKINNQWQGKHKDILVIGDKRGGGSSSLLMNHPNTLNKLKDKIGIELKLIHIQRNPFDIITTRARGGNKNLRNITSNDIDKMIDSHFKYIETINQLKNNSCWNILDLKHEDFIDNSRDKLQDLCHFLGLDPSNEYLNACSSIVFNQPHKSRFDKNWTKEQIKKVETKIKEYPFLNGYSYND